MSNRTRILAPAIALALAAGCHTDSSSRRQLPGDPTQHYVRGQILADQGQLDAALDELRLALQADPNLSVAHDAVGSIYLRKGDFQAAQQAYQRATEINPLAFKPAYNLGVTYQALADAARDLQNAQKYLRRAVQTYLRAITLKDDDYDANLNLSACYYSLGSVSMAEHYCRAAVAIDPRRVEGYENLAVILQEQDKAYDAIQAYRRALEFDTNRPDLLLRLGTLYLQQGRTQSALEVFSRASELSPKSATAHVMIGQTHYNRREYDQAVEAFTTATRVDAGNPSAWRGLGISYMQKFLAEPEQTSLRDRALDAWNRSLELDPNQPGLQRLVRKYTPQRNLPQL